MATRISDHVPGIGRVMATDGGPHPAWAWARVTAEALVSLGGGLSGERYAAALKLQAAIVALLEPHHAKAQDHERGQIASAGTAHLLTPLEAAPHLDDTVADVIAAALGTPWEAQFNASADAIRGLIATHYRSSQHIERSWHVDRTLARDPANAHARAWLAAHHPGHSLIAGA